VSGVVQSSPTATGNTSDRRSPIAFLALILMLLAGLTVMLELQLLSSAAGKEAARRIRQDSRVRAQFGDEVHIPFAAGFASLYQAWIYSYVSGKQSHGYAVVKLNMPQDQWRISRLEVYDRNEGYVINLADPKPAARPEQLQGWGSLYFAPLGDGADADVGDLASFFLAQFGIPAKILPAMPLPTEAYDAHRQRWVAELVEEAMAARYPEIAADPDAKIIGILEGDLYIRAFNWDYTYSYRGGGKYSVVPTVRLDPGFDHFPPSASIRMERLRKVTMKAVGLLYLNFQESADPQSVDALERSIPDIDRMGGVYLASDADVHSANGNYDGSPCLTFFSDTVRGRKLDNPIVGCWQQEQTGEGTQYQIDLARGRFQLTRNDLYRGGPMPLVLQRMNFSYHFDDKVRAFGKDSWQSLDDTVWSTDPKSIQTISINGALFQRTEPGTGFSPQAQYRAGPSSGAFSDALLRWEDGGWRIDTYDGEVWRYLGCGAKTRVPCYYLGRANFRGDKVEITRDPTTGHIQKVSQKTASDLPAAAGLAHSWTPSYDGETIIEIEDNDGRTAHYRYDRDEFLSDVETDGHSVHFDYDSSHHITTVIEDGRTVRIHYDSEGRPDRIELPNGAAYSVKYSQDSIEVNVPGVSYTVSVLPAFFRLAENKTN
jgi:YD repeat-containing protein